MDAGRPWIRNPPGPTEYATARSNDGDLRSVRRERRIGKKVSDGLGTSVSERFDDSTASTHGARRGPCQLRMLTLNKN